MWIYTMSKLCDLSQKWANYFPLYYNIRSYPYSAGRMLLNSAAEFIEAELDKIDKIFNDKGCLNHTRFDLGALYECTNVPKVSEDTNVVLTGTVGIAETVTTGNVVVYFNGADLYNHVYFDAPDIIESTYASIYNLDVTIIPTGLSQDTACVAYFGFEDTPRICVEVSGVYNNASMLQHERYVIIEGYHSNDLVNLKQERLQVIWNGVYKTKNLWNYVKNIK